MTEQFRRECEARFWRKYARENGRAAWEECKERIRKLRGFKALRYLVEEMNRK